MQILGTALAGLSAASDQFDRAAARMSTAGSSATPDANDTSNLVNDVVDLLSAKQAFSANLKTIQVADEMTKHTLDIFV